MKNKNIINKNQWNCKPSKAIQIWSISATFIVAQFFLQLSMGVIVKELRHSLLVDAFELSIISSSYYVIYFILQTPAGILIDRFGSRIVLTVSAGICFIGCLCFAKADSIWLAILGRLLMGTGMAFAFIASINVAAKWFPMRYLAFMTSLSEAVAMLGAMGGNIVLAKLISHFSWQDCYFTFAFIVLFMGLICWLFLQDAPNNANLELNQETEKIDFSGIINNLYLLLKSKNIWLLGMYISICYTIITVYCALWGIPFLAKKYHLELYDATFAISLGYLGMCVGGMVFTWLFNSNALIRKIMIIAPVFLSCIISILIYMPISSLYLIYLLNFLLGFITSIAIFSYALAAELAPNGARNTSVGVINTLALVTAPILQSAIGLVLDLQVNQVSGQKIEIYSVFNYQIALSILPLFIIIAAVVAYCVRFNKVVAD